MPFGCRAASGYRPASSSGAPRNAGAPSDISRPNDGVVCRKRLGRSEFLQHFLVPQRFLNARQILFDGGDLGGQLRLRIGRIFACGFRIRGCGIGRRGGIVARRVNAPASRRGFSSGQRALPGRFRLRGGAILRLEPEPAARLAGGPSKAEAEADNSDYAG